MASTSTVGAIAVTVIGPLNSKIRNLPGQAEPAAEVNKKIDKSAKEFESILLGSWLQQAEQSFGSLPGGDDDADADAGKEQFQGFAMQSLGTAMTAAGGIGIAKMIAAQLHRAADARTTAENTLQLRGQK